MDMLNAMQTFVAVAENSGITAAADKLGCSKAIVSRTLSLLEERLDVRLLNRTTRKVSLTEAGTEYLEHCRAMLEQNAEIESRFAEKGLEPQGHLRISSPMTFGTQHITPVLPEFIDKYPKVQVDIQMTDRFVDIVEQGMDLAIRIGATGSDSLIVRKFAETQHQVAASPELIEKMGGMPKTVEDLKSWPTVAYSLRTAAPSWQSSRVNPELERARSNNGEAILRLAEAGVGLAYIPTFIMEDSIKAGKLKVLLPGIAQESTPLYILYPHRRRLALKTRVFIDFMVQKFSNM
ncbi:LysR family transcriptional regulator [Maritalea porphyrae]|uniref:LysR family transcriptional regulator n=1 Tax=Maritalea porphyrae TaxID=880732 RepID=A0ABQ5UUQ8_9HYPH|nr:LysR family transcriptional regulator [Maritalea porphyrae]GLQ18994.1 LysR family transcriptional regulator [Maritalea porphyrae]